MFEKQPLKLSEKERQIKIEQKKRCGILGKRLMWMFWITVIGIMLTIALLVVSRSVTNSTLLIVLSWIGVGVHLISLGILFSVGKFHNDYRIAACIAILTQVCEVFKSVSEYKVNAAFFVLGAFLGVAYTAKLCAAMKDCLNPVDEYLGDSWKSYLKAYIVVNIGLVLSALAVFTDLAQLAWVVGILVFSIASIIVSFVQLHLLRRTSNAMTEYSRTPVKE